MSPARAEHPRRPDRDAGPARGGGRAPRSGRPAPDPDARSVAFAVLRAVSEDDAYANLVMPRLLREAGLDARAAALATEYAYGTLRGRGTYDAVLAACVDRPLAAVDAPVLDALRLGAHQLLGTRTAPHAAVSETVDLVRRQAGGGAAGFANAVLRRVARRDLGAWLDVVAPLTGTDAPEAHDAALALRTSHPAWMVGELRRALEAHGRPADELDAALAADNERATVTLSALPGLCERDEVLADTAGAQPGRWAPTAVRLSGGGDPSGVAAVAQGRARVQDEGSQLVALALLAAPVLPADAPDVAPPDASSPGAPPASHAVPERWLDLCAGPGGKAALLAANATTAGHAGAHLTAVEVAPHRARLVRGALAPLDAETWTVLVGDGREVAAEQPASFDRVLLDAPCTGTGALRRRPEARWRRTREDLADLVGLQRALLVSALAAVRPGGVVAYCTCSPLAQETVDVVAAVTDGREDVELLDAPAAMATVAGRAVPDVGDGPSAQLWPHLQGTDAMFLALLRRR